MYRIRVYSVDPKAYYIIRQPGKSNVKLTRSWMGFKKLPFVVKKKPWYFEVEKIKDEIVDIKKDEDEPENEEDIILSRRTTSEEIDEIEKESAPTGDVETTKVTTAKKNKDKKKVMAYSQKADLIKAKDETILKQIAGTSGIINDDWIMEGIEAADSEIDVNCEKYYEVPFDPVPKIIKKWSVQLALCWLYHRSNVSNKSAEDEAGKIREDLKLASKGKLDIPGSTKKITGGVIVSDVYEDNIFTMEDLEV